jgi:hypothetical protein
VSVSGLARSRRMLGVIFSRIVGDLGLPVG